MMATVKDAADTLFERLGGAERLRPIIRDFVRAVREDAMIGFFFSRVNPGRLEMLEYQFTARFLGANIPYEGRTMRAAHAAHPIMGGQFDRRRQILVECLATHDVPQDIQAAWLGHVDKLRGQITKDAAGTCQAPEAPSEAPRGPFGILSGVAPALAGPEARRAGPSGILSGIDPVPVRPPEAPSEPSRGPFGILS